MKKVWDNITSFMEFYLTKVWANILKPFKSIWVKLVRMLYPYRIYVYIAEIILTILLVVKFACNT